MSEISETNDINLSDEKVQGDLEANAVAENSEIENKVKDELTKNDAIICSKETLNILNTSVMDKPISRFVLETDTNYKIENLGKEVDDHSLDSEVSGRENIENIIKEKIAYNFIETNIIDNAKKEDEHSEVARLTTQTPTFIKEESNKAVLLIPRPLCSNYKSDSDSNPSSSCDSESDSPLSTGSSSDSEDNVQSNKAKQVAKHSSFNGNCEIYDLPPIEDLKISVPEKACEEIGTITSIIDTLVVVESYKGTAALDVDTILFLDFGKRPLGKIFEILGPVAEPVYTIRFNNHKQITDNDIKKGEKVYYAPKTKHTTFVFLSEVLKLRGSDASWKDNIEAPSEFQDFSDDEEEKNFRNKVKNQSDSKSLGGLNASRKRVFSGQLMNRIQPSRFQNPIASQFSRGSPRFSSNQFHTAHPRNSFSVAPTLSSPCVAPLYNGIHFSPYNNLMSFPSPTSYNFPHRFSGPPFGSFQLNHTPNLPRPFFQQTTHTPPDFFRMRWPLFSPPPPPPEKGGSETSQKN